MATLDGVKAANNLLGFKRYTTGMCLEAVHKALGKPASDRAPGSYQYARNVWENTPVQHRHGDRTPPAGAIVLFLNTHYPKRAGHIAISLGGGNIASTDKPGIGQTGRSSISAIEGSWGGRTYLGWTDRYLGHTVITAKPSIPAPAQNGTGTYTVVRGDTLSAIASRLKTTTTKLYNDNKAVIGSIPSLIKPGQKLKYGKAATPAPSPAKPSGRPTIRKGSKGADVLAWQKFLKKNYPAYAGSIALDSNFQSQTEAMTKEWQRRSGITVDGVVGSQSWKKAGI